MAALKNKSPRVYYNPSNGKLALVNGLATPDINTPVNLSIVGSGDIVDSRHEGTHIDPDMARAFPENVDSSIRARAFRMTEETAADLQTQPQKRNLERHFRIEVRHGTRLLEAREVIIPAKKPQEQDNKPKKDLRLPPAKPPAPRFIPSLDQPANGDAPSITIGGRTFRKTAAAAKAAPSYLAPAIEAIAPAAPVTVTLNGRTFRLTAQKAAQAGIGAKPSKTRIEKPIFNPADFSSPFSTAAVAQRIAKSGAGVDNARSLEKKKQLAAQNNLENEPGREVDANTLTYFETERVVIPVEIVLPMRKQPDHVQEAYRGQGLTIDLPRKETKLESLVIYKTRERHYARAA